MSLPIPSLTLLHARCGERLRVVSLCPNSPQCSRLRELGFCESAEVCKVAEGGAMICQLRGTRGDGPRGADAGMTAAAPEILSALGVGQKGRVLGFDLAADQRQRLLEMGLTVGVEFEVVRFAPLGDPMELKVRGYHLSLRKRDAACIRVALI